MAQQTLPKKLIDLRTVLQATVAEYTTATNCKGYVFMSFYHEHLLTVVKTEPRAWAVIRPGGAEPKWYARLTDIDVADYFPNQKINKQ